MVSSDWSPVLLALLPALVAAVASVSLVALGTWMGVRALWRDGRTVRRWIARRRRGESVSWPPEGVRPVVFYRAGALSLAAAALAQWAQALIPRAH